MAEKEKEEKDKEKEAEKAPAEGGEKAEEGKEPGEKTGKKNKIILIAGIGGVLLLVLIIGGFIIFKTMAAKKQAALEMAMDAGGPSEVPGSGDKPGEEKKDNHGKPEEKKDDHGKKEEKKDDGKKEEKKDDGKKADPAKKDDGKKDEVKGTNNFGDVFNLPKMDMNLGNPLESRYLRIGVSIEYRGGEEQQSEIKQREVQIKDIIITTVTSKTRSQLLTPNGKELLRREILNKINEVADKPVQNVFFTEFLVE